MKMVLLLSLALATSSVFSADKKKTAQTTKPNLSQLGQIDQKTLDMDPKSKDEEVVEDTALLTEPSNVKVNFSCKAKDGHEIKQGEAGYDDCLQKVKNEKHKPGEEAGADIKVNFGN